MAQPIRLPELMSDQMFENFKICSVSDCLWPCCFSPPSRWMWEFCFFFGVYW